MWIARYDGTVHAWDEARALSVDDSENVYVTGISAGADEIPDYATVKYDRDGNQVWVARYDGPAGNKDTVYCLAIDGSGNVYVTGASWSEIGNDFATVKYDSDGNQLWVARHDGPASGVDGATSIVVDGDEGIYVTGASRNGGHDDYATIKYDRGGSQLWVARYDGLDNSADYPCRLVADDAGSAYVTGWSQGGGHDDCATVKYDGQGNQLWVARYNGPGNGDDAAQAIAVDKAGSIYVTRKSWNGSDYDYTTVKYSSEAWVPFTPTASRVELVRRDSATVEASITYASAGYRVEDWGTVVQDGSVLKTDSIISRWTGPSAMVVTQASQQYGLGSLSLGSYTFEFWANGILVRSLAFTVSSRASTPTSKPAFRTLFKPVRPNMGIRRN